MKSYLDHGIHVMVSQNGKGELTIGDSHEYGLSHDPFDNDDINRLILAYLKKFASLKTGQLKNPGMEYMLNLLMEVQKSFFLPNLVCM